MGSAMPRTKKGRTRIDGRKPSVSTRSDPHRFPLPKAAVPRIQGPRDREMPGRSGSLFRGLVPGAEARRAASWLMRSPTFAPTPSALTRPTGRSTVCRPHWLARREWQETTGKRAGAIRESAGSAGHDPIGVAISHVPEGQCLGAVVSGPHRKRPRKTMIVALARKLLIALWRLVREGVVPDGIVLRPAQ
jgi:hypothetical protein